MVYVKQVTVKNFKSFGGTVRLSFERGLNVLTGPNGSGKSNVIDAILFCLGELSTARLRVHRLSDVVFEGGARVARVSLRFDNTDRALPVDKDYVTVSRSIDRNGVSVYRVDGRRVSRTSLLKLLDVAGISPKMLNIVTQGTVTRFSELNPAERMRLLESLLGISEYDARKAKAERRLREADAKVEAARARMEEVRKRLIQLEGERNDAIRYSLLKSEERMLEAYLKSSRLLELESKKAELRGALESLSSELEGLKAERDRLESRRAELKAELARMGGEKFEEARSQLSLVEAEAGRRRVMVEDLRRTISNLRQEESFKQSELQEVLERLSEVEEEAKGVEAELREVRAGISDLSGELSKRAEKVSKLSSEISRIRRALRRSREGVFKLKETAAKLREEAWRLRVKAHLRLLTASALREQTKRALRKRRLMAKTAERLSEYLSRLEKLREEREKALEAVAGEAKSRLEAERRVREAVRRVREMEERVRESLIKLSVRRSLFESLRKKKAAVSRIIEMGEAGLIDGVYGKLSDMISFDSSLRKALEASSAGWMDSVVVRDMETAEKCLEIALKAGGDVRIIPVAELEPGRVNPPGVEGVVGVLSDLVRCEGEVRRAVEFIWGGTILVEDVEAGLALSSKGFRAVTRDGVLFEPRCRIEVPPPKAGSVKAPSSSAVKSLKELESLLRKKRSALTSRLRDVGREVKKLSKLLDSSLSSIREVDETSKRVKAELSRLRKLNAWLERKVKALRREASKNTRRAERLRSRARGLVKKASKLERRMLEKSTELLEARLSRLEEERERLESDAKRIRKRLEELRSRESRLAGKLEHALKPEVQKAEREVSDLRRRLEKVRTDISNREGELRKALEDLDGLESKAEELREFLRNVAPSVRRLREELDSVEARISALNRDIESLGERRSRLMSELSVVEFEAKQVREELESIGWSSQPELQLSVDEAERRLKEVREEISSIGAVNQLAVEQYAEVVNSYKRLSVRLSELERERQSILDFIESIEREKREVFMRAFREISERFSRIFSRLSGGGVGMLKLQDEENPFSAGLEVLAQLPGKPMREVSGMSGGEKSIAAIAYLLALQTYLKAPFYLFDEVDAHLDDLNVRRLAEVLKAESANAQFIVISLKAAMVEAADRVYGFYARRGVSKAVCMPRLVEVVA